MATNKNFIVKNGLEVGGQEVVSSSGVVTSAALGGQTLSSTDSPTFADLTLTGNLNLTGDLNITGDVNSLSVTDLDVTDQTITLGAGQVESASGGSGIVVDGSLASILWDETNDWWDYNKGIRLDGEGLKLSFRTSSTSADGEIYTGDTFGSNRLIIAGENGIHNVIDGNANGVGDWSVYNDNTSRHLLYVTGSNGHVGIGTTTASHGLTVSDAIAGTSASRRITIQSTTHGVNAGYRFDTESANGTGRAGGLYYEPSDTAGASYIGLTGDDANNHFAVTEEGSVGVGTSTPQTLFETATTGTTTNRLTVSSANEFTQIWVEDNDLQGILWKDGSKFTLGAAADVGGNGWDAYITIEDGGNVGIGDVPSSSATGSMSPRLFIDNNLGDSTLGLQIASYHPSIVLSDKSAGLHNYKISHDGGIFAIGYEGGTAGSTNSFTGRLKISSTGNVGIGSHTPGHPLHLHGGNAHTNLVVSTNDGYKSEVRMMEDADGTTHGGFIRYDGNGDYVQIGHYNSGTEMMGWSMDDTGNIAVGATNASGHFEVHGGRMGIVSTDSSWEQLRVCNTSTTGEAGIAIFNGANSGEFLSDTQPIFSNAFTLAINPYGCGSDTLAIGHGNLGDSIWHIDGSGNFGYGPNTENPVSYYEISKTRPNVNAPSDYELKLTLNTYGYVGSNYKLGMLQFLGGDTAGAQDNFYAALSARAANGANNQEDGALQFHVKTAGYSDTLAAEFNGDNNPGSQIAGSGSVRNGMLFRWQGIAIDRSWGNYPGIAVMNSSDYSTTASTQAEFRVHGTNGSSSSYPSNSGSDFSVNFRVDGSYISGSDRRRKTNITTIDNALEKVNQLTGKRFQTVNRAGEVNEHQSKADNYKFGLIAQEVEDIIPEATKYYEDEDDGTEGWNSSYSIDYPSLTALLINAIKEQDVVIQDLKTRIEALEG